MVCVSKTFTTHLFQSFDVQCNIHTKTSVMAHVRRHACEIITTFKLSPCTLPKKNIATTMTATTDVLERLRCLVCLEFAEDPVVCPGGHHVLCEQHFLQAMERLPYDKSHVSCPGCRLEGEFTHQPILTLLSKTLPRTCDCGEEVVQNENDHHKRYQCALGIVVCDWCGIGHTRRAHEDHSRECACNPVLGLKRTRQSSPEMTGNDETIQPRAKRRAAVEARQRISVIISLDVDSD